MTHSIVGPAANSDDASVLDADFQTTAVGAEDTARLYPALRFFAPLLIDANRPLLFAMIRSSWPPNVCNTVAALHCAFLNGFGS